MTDEKIHVQRPFRPDWVTHPGEHLQEYLETWQMSQAELAERTGLHRKTINAIVRGNLSITAETAVLLEPVFGMPARFWLNLDAQYHERIARWGRRDRLKEHTAAIKRFPINAMQGRGLLPKTRDHETLAVGLLEFFALGDFAQWERVWLQTPLQVAYRKKRSITKTPELTSVWLREGQRMVEHAPIVPYDATALRDAVPRMRQLTTEPVEQFWPLLQQMCAGAGVSLIRVAPYPSLGVYAATYRYHGRTVLQISGLQRGVDQFWFSFFHEIGHVLLHGVKELFLDENTTESAEHTDTAEAEANAFAARTLLPDGAVRKFVRETKAPYSEVVVTRFAAQQGVHPGIVVGRLQYEQQLPFATPLSMLKGSYSWDQEAHD